MRHRASGLLSNTGAAALSGASALGVRPEGVVVAEHLRGLFDASLISGFSDGQRIGSWLNRGTVDVELEFNENDRGAWQHYVVSKGRPAIRFEDRYTANTRPPAWEPEHMLLMNGEQNVIVAHRAIGPDPYIRLMQGTASYFQRDYTITDDELSTSIDGYGQGPESRVSVRGWNDGRWHVTRFHITPGGEVNFWQDNRKIATDPDHGRTGAIADRNSWNRFTARNVDVAMIATAGHLTDLQLRDLSLRAEGKDPAGAAWSWWLLIAALAGGTVYYAGRESKGDAKPSVKPSSEPKTAAQ